MKLLKKCLIMLLASTMLFTACAKAEEGGESTTTTTEQGGTQDPAPQDERSLEEIYNEILDGVTAEMPALVQQKVPNNRFEYYFGITKPASAKETLVAEPAIGSIPFAITLLRVDASADANALAKEIKEKVDPRRWVCVAATYVETVVKGDVILLVLDGDDARGAEIVNAFKG